MKVNPIPQSPNNLPLLLRAKAVCELMKKQLPFESSSMLSARRKAGLPYSATRLRELDETILRFRFKMSKEYDSERSWFYYIRKYISHIKRNKVANCAECGRLSEIVFKMNGIDNIRSFNTYCVNGKNFESLDHCIASNSPIQVLKRPPDFCGFQNVDDFMPMQKGSFICDFWLGIVDESKNMMSRWRSEHSALMGVKSNTKIRFLPTRQLQMTDRTVKALRKEFPELLLENSSECKS